MIGGYLGAGKTTLVNHLLRQAAGQRIAVLVNDFGDINIDADLIANATGGADTADDGPASSTGQTEVLALSGGCLCCSFGDDLVGTLRALASRSPPLDHVLIELSGVALPAAVVRTARLAPGIAIAGTLVVADAADLRRLAADRYLGDTVRQQLAQADWVVLNQPARVSADALAALQQWLPGVAPQAGVLACSVTDLPAEWLLGWPADAWPADQRPMPAPDAPTGADALARWAGRAPARPAQALFSSRSLALPDGCDLAALGARLVAPGSGVLRAKGLARAADGSGQLLQVANGRWAVTPARLVGDGRLVLIGLRGLRDLLGQTPADDPAWPLRNG